MRPASIWKTVTGASVPTAGKATLVIKVKEKDNLFLAVVVVVEYSSVVDFLPPVFFCKLL